MIIDIEKKEAIENLSERWQKVIDFLQVKTREARLKEIQTQLADDNFWQADNVSKAQALQREAKEIERSLEQFRNGERVINELKELYEFCKSSDLPAEEEAQWQSELEQALKNASQLVDSVELQAFLSGPMDRNNAIVTIHAGAGGTEACDWAQMVFRMYLRWAERKDFTTEIQTIQDGEEAGISRVTFSVSGTNAYGYLKAERGVHRLVRISPFDANRKRHTSFCAVDVVAELDDDIDVPIEEKDIRIDTYRASGKGGQHVNKTESAVRITHFPTGIVVTCQNERSQIKNRATAMKVLKARIYEKMQDEKRSALERFYGEKGEIGWGYQIRSYVFQPYQMVKDLRTNTETGNVQAVMDGDIDLFIEAWLRSGQPRTRI
ncbi:MAG: peptide chain release factor 2 [bacterium]